MFGRHPEYCESTIESRPDRPSPGASALARICRCAAIAAIVWVGWTTAGAWSDLLEPASTPRGAAVGPPEFEHPAIFAEAGSDGTWTFGDSPGRLGVSRVSRDEAIRRLVAPVEASAGGLGNDDLLDLARLLADRRRKSGPGALYTISRPGMMATAFSRGEGDAEELIAARVAASVGDGEDWLFFESTPRDERAVESTSSLPLPAPSRRLAARWDGDHRPGVEVLAVPMGLSDLARCWTEAGWTALDLGGGGPEGVAIAHRRGSEEIVAWAAGEGGSESETILVLVRRREPDRLGRTR